MINLLNDKHGEQADSALDARELHKAQLPSTSRDHRCYYCGRHKACPRSDKHQKFIQYNPQAPRKTRTKSRQSDPSSHKRLQPEGRDTTSLANGLSSSTLATSNLGRLNQPAIDCATEVQTAVQYYTEVYAPLLLQRPQYAGHGTDWGLLQDLIPFTLSEPMVLSSTIALMELVQNKVKGAPTILSKSVIRHATNTVRGLQTKLASQEHPVGDDVVLSVLNLAAIEFHGENFERLNIHSRALTRILELRGTDRLGFDRFLRYNVLAYNGLFAQMRVERPPKTTFEHPSHPFSSTMCKQISDLPDAFHEPIFAQQLCSSSVDILHFFHTLRTQKSPNTNIPLIDLRKASVQCVCIIREPELPTFERIVLMGLMACVIHFDDSGEVYRMFKPFLQVQCQAALSSGEYLGIKHESQRNLMVWAACLLIAETVRDSCTSKLGHKVLGSVVEELSWEQRMELCQGFFWDELCMDELVFKVKQECVPPRIAGSQHDLKVTESQETLSMMLNHSMSFIFESMRAPAFAQYE